jgi:protein farnesyltransferase/geranylgeranyltransferase type-1 subunit alpha
MLCHFWTSLVLQRCGTSQPASAFTFVPTNLNTPNFKETIVTSSCASQQQPPEFFTFYLSISTRRMSKYAESPTWSDIDPIPQDDGPGQPLAAIAYTEAYSEGMSYLRAVMAKNEMSERVLELTEDIIQMNPAHYTVWYVVLAQSRRVSRIVKEWNRLAYIGIIIDVATDMFKFRLYRARVLFTLNAPLRTEIEWLNPTSLRHQKNYQIWHHRQTIIDRLDDPTGEQEFISQMFALDSKNYHVWSYRQWLVKRFGLWDDGELEAVELLLKIDVRNNSAWNHRWYVVFGRDEEGGVFGDEKVVQREVEYVYHCLLR